MERQRVGLFDVSGLSRREGVAALLRGNRSLEAAVNRGLAAVYLLGLTAGAQLMREEGVPPEVMRRVLMHPRQRRSGDWRRCSDGG